MESVAYVGMDVDKEKIAVALLQDYEDQPRMQRVIRNRANAIEKFFGEVNRTLRSGARLLRSGSVWL